MDDVHPKMRFSLSPPPPKAIFSSTVTPAYRCSSDPATTSAAPTPQPPPSVPKSQYHFQNNNNTINTSQYAMQRQEDTNNSNSNQTDKETSSDYKQWLHAMKLVARLPGGIPPEFRRKLWLSLADKYLKSKNVDWEKEEEKCFCEKWREDDEELGIQIVKDLHRTGSTLCTGPAGDINQAKLKRILLGYARYNPEVGYCQGFNMLGALILQVMDKEESESIKVMIYLVEGILPTGYFCGSMGGLQADMAVFRELMQTKLPRLAKHLQKLQGPVENAFEPPLTNVFTMQWFLTMFCTCLPMSCVLRVWDLVLIEGSDVLLRTALALWSLLEERVLSTRSADDFYGKMGSFSSELLNGHLIDSNGLIEKVVQLGPIPDIQKLRDKHLYNIAPLRNQQGLHLYYDDDEPDMDEDSRLAVATVWGIPWGRRGSQGQTTANAVAKQATESKDRIALDISLLKKQYDRLRERQKQAHIILTTACSTARQGSASNVSNAPALPVNQLLSGRPAIVTNKGRRSGPPIGAIPPARKPSLPAVLQEKPLEKHLRRGETLNWRDTGDISQRRDSLSWKEIKAERAAMITSGSVDGLKSQKIRSRRLGKSDSSSYSEESDDDNDDKEGGGSSTDTSLCDDDNPASTGGRKKNVDVENNHKSFTKFIHKTKKMPKKQRNLSANIKEHADRERPKSWAPSNSEIPFVLMTIESPNNSADENSESAYVDNRFSELLREGENSATESDQMLVKEKTDLSWKNAIYSPVAGDLATSKLDVLPNETGLAGDLDETVSANQVSSPDSHKTAVIDTVPKTHFKDSTNSLGSADGEEDEVKMFDVSDEGVTNQYFERVNSTERPTKLDLLYSLNEEDSIRDAYKGVDVKIVDSQPSATSEQQKNTVNIEKLSNSRCMDLLDDYSEKSSAACIAEAKTEISTTLQTIDANAALFIRKEPVTITDEIVLKRPKLTAAEKRRNPRRLTLTRSSTMDIEKRYQALEKRLSMEVSSKYKPFFGDSDKEDSDNLRSSIKVYETNKIHIPLEEKHNEIVDAKRRIPSTADLEERFKNMQLHLVRDRDERMNAPCDSESTAQQKNGETRKMSTPESSKNASSNAKKQDQTGEEANAKKDEVSEDKTQAKESDLKKSISTQNEADKEEEKDNVNRKATVSPHESDLKQTPEKSSALKSKKEPPDNKTNDTTPIDLEIDNNKSVDETSSQGTKKDISKESTNSNEEDIKQPEDSEPIQENSKLIKSPKDKENVKESSLDNRQSEEKQVEEVDKNVKTKKIDKAGTENEDNRRTQGNENKDDSKSNSLAEKSSTQRKSPPSTEELEKRFSALEKQMSVTKNEPNEVQRNLQTEGEISGEKSTSETNKPKDFTNKEADQNNTAKDADNKPKIVLSASNKIFVDNAKRRLSEPPSTEDLEKRYEVLKRRMSSKNFEAKTFTKGKNIDITDGVEKDLLETEKADSPDRSVNKNLQPSKEANENSPPSTENLEKRYEELQSKSKRNELSSSITKQSPPSTENLEKRYEELQNKSDKDETKHPNIKENSPTKHSPSSVKKSEKDSINGTTKQTPPSTETLEKRYEELQNKSDRNETTKENSEAVDSLPSTEEKHSKEIQVNSTTLASTNDGDKNKVQHIEELEAKAKSPVLDSGSRQKRTALITELQSKMKSIAGGESVKPSSINPTRRPPAQNALLASKSFNDETSETHATSAYSRSGKYELRNSSNRKMVRRFSDLPSRADLENRLQFLEEQLSKTLRKQRRSSDSEVASKQHRSEHNITFSNVPPPPPPPPPKPLSGSLERRVQELEKHLRENRALSMDAESSQSKNLKHAQESDIEISQIADTLAVTGKELVRYSQLGNGEFDHQNPINISINIQMTLNKDDTENKKQNDVPKTEELDRRLQILEQQLKNPHPHNVNEKEEGKSGETPVQANENKSSDDAEQTKLTEKHAEIKTTSGDNSLQTPNNIAPETNQKLLEESTNEPILKENTSDIADDKIEDNATCSSKNEDNAKCNEEKSKKESEILLSNENTEDIAASKINESEVEIKCKENSTIEKRISQVKDTKRAQNETETNIKTQQNEASRTPTVVDQQTIDQRSKEIAKSEVHTDVQKIEVSENKITDDLQQVQHKLPAEVEKINDETQLYPNREETGSEEIAQKNVLTDFSSKTMGSSSSQMVPIEVNKKTLVLLLDNEPKAVKVRRLTRANTEELEDLFQALEKQISDRGLIKSEEKIIQSNEKFQKQTELEITQAMADLTKEIHQMQERSQLKADEKIIQSIEKDEKKQNLEITHAMADLTKEIQELAKSEKVKQNEPSPKKQKTPIKQEEFDWGTDPIKYHLKKRTVYLPSTKELEARFRSLERQIMLLEHVEKIDVEQRLTEIERKIKLQYSLSHEKDLNKFLELCEGKGLDDVSPSMEKQHERKDCSCNTTCDQKRFPTNSPKHTSPKHVSPKRSTEPIPSTGNLEYRYRALDLKRSRSKQNLKKEPIHPLEMLLDPSPDDSNIPTTGELEHRMRVMDEQRYTPSPPSRKSRSQSPPKPKSNIHRLEAMVTSPEERDLPTAEELEARLAALEKEQCFNFKMQKNFQQFNQKLKDVVSPSLSFDEPTKSCEPEPKSIYRSSSPRSMAHIATDTVSPKTIRFLDDEQQTQSMHRCDNESMTIADSQSSFVGPQQSGTVHSEGLGVMGIRLMRETSPLRRKGTHTGVPLRTGENINDQLTSIKNTIKSIDSLCEEKPYRKERCQQYIDALFSDSTHFATKKSSLEDLTSRNISRSTSRDIGPSIRISDHSPAFTRSMGSADSIRSSSPLRPTSPLQYRSNRDLRREPSPRRRREEDREEHESRVRRDNLLPNNINFNHSTLSHSSHSLTKFHKVDSQLIPNDIDVELDERLRHPRFSLLETMVNHDNNTNTSNTVNTPTTTIPTTTNPTFINEVPTSDPLKSNILDRPISPYRQTGLTNSNTPVYTPAKLEIRHTTVTSTFYDRVLTEKQLEKQQHSNKSPMVSPLLERHVRPSFQTNISSPTKDPYQESANTMTLSDASTGNYRMYQPNIHANNDG